MKRRPGSADDTTHALAQSLEFAWVRVTDTPVTGPRYITDLATGGVNGCFNYAVRPRIPVPDPPWLVAQHELYGEAMSAMISSPHDRLRSLAIAVG